MIYTRYILKAIVLHLCTIELNYAEINFNDVDSIKNWNILQNKKIQIKWVNHSDFPICQTRSTLPFSMKSILNIIEDVENYPKVFKRIYKVNILEEDVVHIMLDMPLFLSNRDYIIKYKKNKTPDSWEFSFNAVKHHNAPKTKDHIRLINAAGLWKIIPIDTNKTSIIYTWNGELLGDFPEFAFERAWKTQGNEIINWISDALE